jgi:hypothetical protein
MGLDIRLPIGMMFTLIGLLLSGSGFLTRADAAMYQCSLGININLIWGLVLLLFGAVMLGSALLAKAKTARDAAASPKSKNPVEALR